MHDDMTKKEVSHSTQLSGEEERFDECEDEKIRHVPKKK